MNYIGKVIKNRYKIYDKVGGGGMATVYLARDLETNEVVAVKILREEYTEDEQYVKRFQKEAEIATKLKHPNITQVRDFGKEEGIYYIVMEYVQGKTLEEIIKEKGKISIENAIEIARAVAEALAYANDHGIIAHRDIKPQNIMVTRDGNVKVMDFGIAKVSETATLTSQGSIIGTPYYLSPEQAKGQPTDIRSDLYSLGITLFQMVTGKLPFYAENPWSVINMHISFPPPKIEELNEKVPEKLREIIYKLLEKNPENRYQLPQELTEDLSKLEVPAQPSETVILTKPPSPETVVLSKEELPEDETALLGEKKTPQDRTVILGKEGVEKEAPQKEEVEKTVILGQELVKEETLKTGKSEEVFAPTREKAKVPVGQLLTSNKKIVFPLIALLVITGILISVFAFKRAPSPVSNPVSGGGTTISSNIPANNPQESNTQGGVIVTKGNCSLYIESNPPNASVFLNDQDTGKKTPATLEGLKAGTYKLALKLEGYKDLTEEITLKEGETLRKSFTLEKTVQTAKVKINSTPQNAEIFIDGKDTNRKTPSELELSEGEHTLKLTLEGYSTLQTTVVVEKDKENIFGFVLQKLSTTTGILTVNSNPTGASVYINDTYKGKTPFKVSLSKGNYKVTLKKEGYLDYSTTVKIEENKETTINVTLAKLQNGTLIVQSTPSGAEIYLNGKDSGHKTPYTLQLPQGIYNITLKLTGYKDYNKSVEVVTGAISTVSATLEKLPSQTQTKTYTDDDGLYTFKYPSDWVLTEHPDGDADVRVDSKYMATCFVYVEDIGSLNLTFSDALDAIRTVLDSNNLKITSAGYVTVENRKFYRFRFEGSLKDTNGNSMPIKGEIYAIEVNGIFYEIEFDATPEDFSKAWPGFELILKSFTPTP